MALFDKRQRLLYFLETSEDRCRGGFGMRDAPERIVLPAKHGVAPSDAPPVRIFLGTEPAQSRAERVFVWSIEQARDPARTYEIYLMKDLAGFDRRRWLTGFTNYRFAIPHFCNGAGRAIWNDVDEIYLTDPAELFDTELGDAGFLTVPRLASGTQVDTSVMVMDCERMIDVWDLESAQRTPKKKMIEHALAVPGLHGLIDPLWNARDPARVGHSKLIHYTILHKQPWVPIPARYVYQRNPVAHVWYDLERSADEAGFHVFSREHPSANFRALASRGESERSISPRASQDADGPDLGDLQEIREMTSRHQSKQLLEMQIGDAAPAQRIEAQMPKLEVTTLNVLDEPDRSVSGFDGVVCTEGLERIPDEDAAWVVEELFERSSGFVYTVIREPAPGPLPSGYSSRTRDWSHWTILFEKAGARHPHVNWKIVLRRDEPGSPVSKQREGGRVPTAPRVWVLLDDSPTHDSQTKALADALGWPYETKQLRFPFWSAFGSLAPGFQLKPASLDPRGSNPLTPPWPDLVIGSGRRASEVARSIGLESLGRTRVIEVDHRAGQRETPFDLVVTDGPSDRPPHPHRIETLAPLTQLSTQDAERLTQEGELVWGNSQHPRVALLVGDEPALTPHVAERMAREVRSFADELEGSIFAIGSQPFRGELSRALQRGLGGSGRFQDSVSPESRLAPLLAADVIVVAGGGRTLLAEACSVGHPVHLYELSNRRAGLRTRIESLVEVRAHARPLNTRGTVRPQQGLEYACSRLIERGILTRPHRVERLREELTRRGLAVPFGTPMPAVEPRALHEAEDVARKIEPLLGFSRP